MLELVSTADKSHCNCIVSQKPEESGLNHRPQKSSAAAGTQHNSTTDGHEASSPTAEPIRSKHQRKRDQKAARKKNANRQQVTDIHYTVSQLKNQMSWCNVMHAFYHLN